MFTFRPAAPSDLTAIHSMQNVPFREQVFARPFPHLDRYLQETANQIASGKEYYFILEETGSLRGFVWFQQVEGDWYATIWGRFLKTLVYAGTTVAFDKLRLPKLLWCVRQTNQRMIQICDLFRFRSLGETPVLWTREQHPYVVQVTLNYYEITAEEFQEKASLLRQQSLPLLFQF